MERIWRKYNHHTDDYLSEQICLNALYRRLHKKHPGAIIPFEDLVEHLQAGSLSRNVEKIVTPDGRHLPKWIPTARPLAVSQLALR